MSSIKFSEAASLALHTMAVLAKAGDSPMTTREIAGVLDASESHLSKVIQRLSKTNLVSSTRGPRGGHILGKDSSDITLLEVYEAIEGSIEPTDCLLNSRACQSACILGDMLSTVNAEIKERLTGTKLSDLSGDWSSKGKG